MARFILAVVPAEIVDVWANIENNMRWCNLNVAALPYKLLKMSQIHKFMSLFIINYIIDTNLKRAFKSAELMPASLKRKTYNNFIVVSRYFIFLKRFLLIHYWK